MEVASTAGIVKRLVLHWAEGKHVRYAHADWSCIELMSSTPITRMLTGLALS